MTAKKYALSKDQIKPLCEERGACIASDWILEMGVPVGFMYREESDFEIDSGWRFMAGDETDEYLDDESNLGIYPVNLIANYDQNILSLLDSPVGSAFEWDPDEARFVPIEIDFSEDEEDGDGDDDEDEDYDDDFDDEEDDSDER